MKAGENASRAAAERPGGAPPGEGLTLPATAGSEKSGEIVLGIDKRWKPDALGVAAFLQDPATLAIHGAASREVGR